MLLESEFQAVALRLLDEQYFDEKEVMDIEATVKKIIVDQLGVEADKVHNDSHFVDDLDADSLDTVELVMAFEEEFDVTIPDDDAEKITTVQSAIDYIKAAGE